MNYRERNSVENPELIEILLQVHTLPICYCVLCCNFLDMLAGSRLLVMFTVDKEICGKKWKKFCGVFYAMRGNPFVDL